MKRTRARAAYFRAYREGRPAPERKIVAIDGEGYSLRSGAHRYVYMAATTDNELVSELHRPKGITFEDFASWLLDELPRGALVVGYSLGYDRTKWVESLPAPAIYSLLHPEERQGKYGPRPVKVGSYRANLVSSLFTLKRESDGARQRVWDLFKFFQASFVKALRAWGFGCDPEKHKCHVPCTPTCVVGDIERMKDKRASFADSSPEIRAYCQRECMLLAKLAKELLTAHEDEGLHLTSYYGPGSTASLILKQCGAEAQSQDLDEMAPELAEAVLSAYFGGRFEDSHVGPIDAPIHFRDIASAYPYGFCLLPCFAHGRFEHVKRWKGERWAVVRYVTNASSRACEAWGPLPHRLADGNIVYPVRSAGGWAWAFELAAGLKIHPGIVPLDAWVWRSKCRHAPPFRKVNEALFARRLVWGKGARGLVLRLGMNSEYGKSAQRVGRGRYRCMVRAGLTTAITRAMLLEGVRVASDPWNVLELATDSILSREPLALPASPLGKLGAWDEKPWEGGVMLLRPGLRFSTAGDDLGKTAARGVGVKTLHTNRELVLRAWEKEPMAPVTVQQPTMFHGARKCVRRVLGAPSPTGEREWTYVRDDLYGRWTDPKPRVLRYSPEPKRCEIVQGPHGIRLVPWSLPQDARARSVPYGMAPPSPLGELVDELRAAEREQPDADMLSLF